MCVKHIFCFVSRDGMDHNATFQAYQVLWSWSNRGSLTLYVNLFIMKRSKNAFKTLTGKTTEKKHLGRTRRGWEYNI